MIQKSPHLRTQIRGAMRRFLKLRRHTRSRLHLGLLPVRQQSTQPTAPLPLTPRTEERPSTSSRYYLAPAISGIGAGVLVSALVLLSLQLTMPQGDYYKRIQIPLARQWGLVEREVYGWASYAEVLFTREQPLEARKAYANAAGLLDAQTTPPDTPLRVQIQARINAVMRAREIVVPLVHPSWGSLLLKVIQNPWTSTGWLDVLVGYPLIQQPLLAALLVLSFWLSMSFVRSLQVQVAWTRILDQERPFSLGRTIPWLLGGGLLGLLLAALLSLSPSESVMPAVVCGAIVPGLSVNLLNRFYKLRARRALDAWESQHRAEFSSELHNTAQQSIMNAQVVLREIISDLENSEDPEAGHYAWRLAEAMERCQEVEDELRVLRNGTEDKFARGQTFYDAIEPIYDRLERRGIEYKVLWIREGESVEAPVWESWAFQLADSARDRRIAATLYQVLSELSWNVIKYACLEPDSVTQMDVTFNCTRQNRLLRYSLEVRDNGPGFDVQSAQDRRPHSGIFSLERYLRRVEIVGAEARSYLKTAPGQGTQITTEIVVAVDRGGDD